MVNVVLGSQWGDEGKGKLVDLLVGKYDIVARCAELETLEAKGLKNARSRLFVSSRAHLVFDFHQVTDKLRELELSGRSKDGKNIGTTGKGIGPTYSTKASRSGLRVHHLVNDQPGAWEEFVARYKRLLETRRQRYGDFEYDFEAKLAEYKKLREQLKPFVVDSVVFMHNAIEAKKKILVEGANALMLDIDFGTYPYVTSSSTGIGGVLTGLGIPPRTIDEIYGVVKAYTTRVGEGPFPTEQLNEDGEKLQTIGAEFGVTTGRKRHVLDTFKEIPVGISYSIRGKKLDLFPEDLNILGKVEVEYKVLPGWDQDITKITKYEDLPENAKKYLKYIEDFVGVPVEWVGTGPARESMLHKEIK
ncbi:CFF_collapsed_G0046020.mRNA.1.CDS.1 [Saccharomyces cerevisiae]|nr:CFF_collapsed_G0046020.mRNA.1.CDS.1 [Saccharomyces cerevisiae]